MFAVTGITGKVGADVATEAQRRYGPERTAIVAMCARRFAKLWAHNLMPDAG